MPRTLPRPFVGDPGGELRALIARLLEAFTKTLPRQTVSDSFGPYFYRYCLTPIGFFPRIVIHRFLRADREAVYHCHGFALASWLLAGELTEERLERPAAVRTIARAPLSVATYGPGDYHRIAALPAGDAWTLCAMGSLEHAMRFAELGGPPRAGRR